MKALLALPLVALLAACGSATEEDDAGTVAVATKRSMAPEARVEKVVLSDADVSANFQVALIDAGDEVEDQVTLDNCEYTFTSEKHRVARRQVDIRLTSGLSTGLFNEVVAYDSP